MPTWNGNVFRVWQCRPEIRGLLLLLLLLLYDFITHFSCRYTLLPDLICLTAFLNNYKTVFLWFLMYCKDCNISGEIENSDVLTGFWKIKNIWNRSSPLSFSCLISYFAIFIKCKHSLKSLSAWCVDGMALRLDFIKTSHHAWA